MKTTITYEYIPMKSRSSEDVDTFEYKPDYDSKLDFINDLSKTEKVNYLKYIWQDILSKGAKEFYASEKNGWKVTEDNIEEQDNETLADIISDNESDYLFDYFQDRAHAYFRDEAYEWAENNVYDYNQPLYENRKYRKKKLTRNTLTKIDAGNVEYNNNVFNNSVNMDAAQSSMCEDKERIHVYVYEGKLGDQKDIQHYVYNSVEEAQECVAGNGWTKEEIYKVYPIDIDTLFRKD